ncbi:MAG: TIGR00725 family protein [Actinomycetota bacterium]|nr:TIGR00725 family protein [Actinomycetota bacterium]MDD5667944.1 TIGR00725 family protein [Actinomycetota bacterium]
MYIGVIGGQICSEEEERMAYELGGLLAKKGAVIVCGGLGGVMEAACRGAREEGGVTIGVLPGPFRGDANPYVDYVIATDMGQARNAIIVRTADAVVAVGGEYGTLSEIAMALKMGKKVVALSSWEISSKGTSDDKIIRAESPAAAVETVMGTGR